MPTKHDQSFGIIPLKKQNDEWHVLLVQLHAGHWGFPKGHGNKDESPVVAAQRELFEETGLTVVRFLSDKTQEESYFFKHNGQLIHKTVLYYVAEVEGKVIMQDLELKDLKWVPLKEANQHMSFEEGKRIVDNLLRSEL